MQYEEYKQLRLWARYDGIYLAILLVGSFACTVLSPTIPFLGAFSSLLLLAAPFFVAFRLRKFRNEALDGHITYYRALFYCLRVFLNGTLFFALFQWLYMKFLDGGRLLALYQSMMSAPEMKVIVKAYGVSQADFNTALQEMFQPTFLACYSLIMGVMSGIVLSLLIAAIMKK